MSMPYSAMPSPRTTKISALPKLFGYSVRAPMAAGAPEPTGNAGADAGDAHGQGGGDHADAHIVVGSGGCGLAVGGEGHAGKGARQCEYGNQYQKGAGKLFNIHLFHNRYSILPQSGVVLI